MTGGKTLIGLDPPSGASCGLPTSHWSLPVISSACQDLI